MGDIYPREYLSLYTTAPSKDIVYPYYPETLKQVALRKGDF